MNNKKNVAQWADHRCNIQYGCPNQCLYCYAQSMALRHQKICVKDWGKPISNPKALEKNFRKRPGITMFPTTHDITPQNLDSCLIVLKKLLTSGNNVLIVSKPDIECIKSLCKELKDYKSQIEFRFTIGSADKSVLKFWEPNAPLLSERILSLKHAYSEGFKTSVSGEPMLDNHPEKLVEMVEPFVTETIWLGKANDLMRRLKINGHKDQITLSKATQLIEWQRDEEIIKLYEIYNSHPKIRWKDSIEKVIENSKRN